MKTPTRLHFGCFNCPLDGWINTDVTPHIFLSRIPGAAWFLHKAGKIPDKRHDEHRQGVFKKIRYLNVTKNWPYAEGFLDAIYSSHVVEHLPLRGAERCFAESLRCLRPDGILRIAVPDLDTLIRDYDPAHALNWAIHFFEAKEQHEKNMHHFMYNFESIKTLLLKTGFSDVVRCEYRQGRCPDVEKLDNRPASLFIEAFK